MSEGIWNIEAEKDAGCLINAVLKDITAQEETLIDETTDIKKQLLIMECDCCNGVPAGADTSQKCYERLEETDAQLRKLAEKRQYFEALRTRCEKKQWDNEKE